MAKDDTQNSAPQARIYKSNAVHKRRVGKIAPPRGDNLDVDAPAKAGAKPDAENDLKIEGAGNLVVQPDAPSDSLHKPLPGEAVERTADQVNSSSALAAVEPAESSGEAASVDNLADEDRRLAEPEGDSLPEEDEVDEEAEPSHEKRRKTDPKTRAKRIALAMLAILVIAAVGLASYYAWDRWGRYDDVADIQGQWYIDGTAASIVVDAQTMQLAENVAYNYEIDPQEKTIRFSFGSWEGQGRYRFSDDRQRLLIIDGEYSGVGNLFDDLFTPFDAMASAGVQQSAATLQEASDAESASSSDAALASGESTSESSQAAPSEQAGASSGQTVASSGQTNVSSEQGGEQAPETPGLGQGVSLFNRQADPVALKAKEEAEKAAQAKAEREAKAAAEAEAAEVAEYGYYDEYYEYDESSDYAAEEGVDEGDQSYSDEEEG